MASRVARSDPITTIAGVAVVATIAWALLWHHAHADRFASAFAMWNVMMVAMMLPSLVPWLSLFSPSGAAIFAAGYFAVWTVYCAAAALLQMYLDGAMLAPRAGGAVLVAAGAFQLTPWKASCLRHCRSPIGYLLTRWQNGRPWIYRVGMAHGLNCLACCWALMALAFALGVMNLSWMAALTLVVVLEKMAPWGERLSRVLGVGLIVWGATVVAGTG